MADIWSTLFWQIQYLLHLVTFLAKLLLNIVCFWFYLCARTWVDGRLALNYLRQPWPWWSSLSIAPASVVVYNEYQLHFLLVIISSIVLTLFSYHDMISYHIIPLLWVAYRNFCVTFPRWKWTSVTTVRVGCSLLWNLPIYQCTAQKKMWDIGAFGGFD